MWKNVYRDYKPNQDWIQVKVEPCRGIIGCEMHEVQGWGKKKLPQPKKRVKKDGRV